MTNPINIAARHSISSASPSSFSSIHDHFKNVRRHEQDGHLPRVLHPIENEDIKLLILENISQEAVDAFKAKGFHVDHYKRAMPEDELVEKIGSYHAIGIRSKTKVTARVIQAAKKVSFADLFKTECVTKYRDSCWLLDVSASVRTRLTCPLLPGLASRCSIRPSPTLVRLRSSSWLKWLLSRASCSSARMN